MSVLRRWWFAVTVVVLGGVIAFNLYTLDRSRGPATSSTELAAQDATHHAAASPESHRHASDADAGAAEHAGHHDMTDMTPHAAHSKTDAPSRHEMGMGRGGMMGGGMMGGGMMGGGMKGGPMKGGGMMADMRTIHALLGENQQITRTVTNIEDGIEAVTESDDADVAKQIREHVWAMHERLEAGRPIRMGDPLFAAIFKHARAIKLQITDTAKGVTVRETSADPYVVRLIQSHAAAVSGFVAEGSDGMHRMHDVPPREPAGHRVEWLGAMRRVMHDGDLSGQADLRSLAATPHLYAVGPLEGLRGEVSIFDGQPFLTRVRDERVVVEKSFRHKACFLVFAQVAEWQSLPIPDSVETVADLEAFIADAARERIDTSAPFPFLVRGTPAETTFHILSKTDDKPHSAEEHDKIKVRFTLNDQAVEMIGFNSDQHAGIFTHHDRRVHIHVRSADGTTGGHVDALKLQGGMTLLLPARQSSE